MKRFFILLLVSVCIMSFTSVVYAEDDATDVEDVQTSAPVEDGSAETDVATESKKPVGETNESPQLTDGTTDKNTIDAPDKYWAQNGYPEDIGFAYEAGGEMREDELGNEYYYAYWEIGIIGANETRKQEIIDMLSPNCQVTFIEVDYSYNERNAVYNEICAAEDENILSVLMMLNTDRIEVVVADNAYEEYVAFMQSSYGDMVELTNELEVATDDVTGFDKGMGSIANWLLPGIIVLVVLLVFGIFYFNRRRFVYAMQTAGSNTVTATRSMSRKEVVEAIKDTKIQPGESVYEKIRQEIEKR